MMITVDPQELAAAAETLRTCAVEAADIGTQLWSCAGCAMPAEIQGVVDQFVVTSDRALDSVAAELTGHANDLSNRALIARNDAQASTMIVASTNPTLASASSSPFEALTIGGGLTVGVATNYGQTMTIENNTPLLISPGLNVAVGETHPELGQMAGIWDIAVVGQQIVKDPLQNLINEIVNNPNSTPEDLRVAFNAQTSFANSDLHIGSTPRSTLEARAGGPLSDPQVRSLDPHTILDPTNIFARS